MADQDQATPNTPQEPVPEQVQTPPQEQQQNPPAIVMDGQQGPHTEKEVKDDIKDFRQRIANTDDATVGPVFNNVNPESIKSMEEKGQLVRIDKSSLEPSVANNPLFNAKDEDGKDIPIYVVPGAGVGKTTARAVLMENNQMVIIANEGAHDWKKDPSYVADHIQATEAQITEAKNAGDLKTYDQARADIQSDVKDPKKQAEMDRRYQEIAHAAEADAQRMGIKNPQILIEDGTTITDGAAAAKVTKEGSNYIIINKDELRDTLSSEDKTKKFIGGIVGHEEAHIMGGDMQPAIMSAGKENIAVTRYEEAQADLVGAGALGSHDPKKAAEEFKDALRTHYAAYMAAEHPGEKVGKPTDADLQKVSDWAAKQDPGHPSAMDRITALNDEAKRMKEYEANFKKENGHAVSTDAERAAESKAVVGQVMKDMAGKWQQPVKPPPAATPENKAANAPKEPSAQQADGSSPQGAKLAYLPELDSIRELLGQMRQAPVDHSLAENVAGPTVAVAKPTTSLAGVRSA